MARMVEKGLDRIGKPLDDINRAIENVGNLELLKLEKPLDPGIYFGYRADDRSVRYGYRSDYLLPGL